MVVCVMKVSCNLIQKKSFAILFLDTLDSLTEPYKLGIRHLKDLFPS